jgi:hypothetical protein
MVKIILIYSVALLFTTSACKSSNDEKFSSIEIISGGAIYKISSNHGSYTVNYRNQEPKRVDFRLTSQEDSLIKAAYSDMRISELPTNLIIEDNCDKIPYVFTRLKIQSESLKKEIFINEKCNKIKMVYKGRSTRVKKFLQIIKNIVLGKPEIRNLPVSDILYI